jgi:hypothetical protein
MTATDRANIVATAVLRTVGDHFASKWADDMSELLTLPQCSATSLPTSAAPLSTKFVSARRIASQTDPATNLQPKGTDQMARRDDAFPSKYLRAADLNGKPRTLVISAVTRETLRSNGGEESKFVCSFRGAKKGLLLNVTNFDAIVDVTGEGDTDDWSGHSVELYPTKTEMKGKTVDAIRVRSPEQGSLATKRPAKPEPGPPEMDDEIPF